MHNVSKSIEDEAQMNFWRGKIAAIEDILGLADELKAWKETHRGT